MLRGARLGLATLRLKVARQVLNSKVPFKFNVRVKTHIAIRVDTRDTAQTALAKPEPADIENHESHEEKRLMMAYYKTFSNVEALVELPSERHACDCVLTGTRAACRLRLTSRGR